MDLTLRDLWQNVEIWHLLLVGFALYCLIAYFTMYRAMGKIYKKKKKYSAKSFNRERREEAESEALGSFVFAPFVFPFYVVDEFFAPKFARFEKEMEEENRC